MLTNSKFCGGEAGTPGTAAQVLLPGGSSWLLIGNVSDHAASRSSTFLVEYRKSSNSSPERADFTGSY